MASHGSSTLNQKWTLLTAGSIFWIVVIIAANFINFENTAFKAGVGSACVREFKICIVDKDWNACAAAMYNCGDISQDRYGFFDFPASLTKITPRLPERENFTNIENIANRKTCLYTSGFSRSLCENLCFAGDFSNHIDQHFVKPNQFTMDLPAPGPAANIMLTSLSPYNTGFLNSDVSNYDHTRNTQCVNICKMASDLQSSDDCPYESRCPDGCPCPGYKCKKGIPDHQMAVVMKMPEQSVFNLPGIIQPHFQTLVKHFLYKIEKAEEENLSFREIQPLPIFDPVGMQMGMTSFFCLVPFGGSFFLIQSSLHSSGSQLTLWKVLNDGTMKKLSTDRTRLIIIFEHSQFTGKRKLCGSGVYKISEREKQIIFCSTADTGDLCQTYKISGEAARLGFVFDLL